jgi:hypothetical protein
MRLVALDTMCGEQHCEAVGGELATDLAAYAAVPRP